MTKAIKITVWYQLNEKGNTKLNHIEDGWVLGKKPQPKHSEFSLQSAWQNMEWAKNFRVLIDSEVTKA